MLTQRNKDNVTAVWISKYESKDNIAA